MRSHKTKNAPSTSSTSALSPTATVCRHAMVSPASSPRRRFCTCAPPGSGARWSGGCHTGMSLHRDLLPVRPETSHQRVHGVAPVLGGVLPGTRRRSSTARRGGILLLRAEPGAEHRGESRRRLRHVVEQQSAPRASTRKSLCAARDGLVRTPRCPFGRWTRRFGRGGPSESFVPALRTCGGEHRAWPSRDITKGATPIGTTARLPTGSGAGRGLTLFSADYFFVDLRREVGRFVFENFTYNWTHRHGLLQLNRRRRRRRPPPHLILDRRLRLQKNSRFRPSQNHGFFEPSRLGLGARVRAAARVPGGAGGGGARAPPVPVEHRPRRRTREVLGEVRGVFAPVAGKDEEPSGPSSARRRARARFAFLQTQRLVEVREQVLVPASGRSQRARRALSAVARFSFHSATRVRRDAP